MTDPLLDTLARVLHDSASLADWPTVRGQLAPLADLAVTELAPAAAGRFRRELRDVERYPKLWALTLAFTLRGELPSVDDSAPGGPSDETLPANAEARSTALHAQLAAIRAQTDSPDTVDGRRADDCPAGGSGPAFAVAPGPAVAGGRQHNVEICDPRRPLTSNAGTWDPKFYGSHMGPLMPSSQHVKVVGAVGGDRPVATASAERHCRRCNTQLRQPGQRWCRACRTAYERERRRQRRQGARQGVLVGAQSPALARDFGYGVERCGHDALPDWAPGCGQLFPARRSGQRYCCQGHGAGEVWHTDGCPIKAQGPPPGTR